MAQDRPRAEADPGGLALLPVRMINEYVYCPRLFHLMFVEGRWADNEFTVEGKHVHRRVDERDHVLPDPSAAVPQDQAASGGEGDPPPAITRSVPLASERLGIVGKLDLVATAQKRAVPVETKRGHVPNTPERCYEPERVQLMAQGLLLREHGYECDHGVLYYAGSRTRVEVPFTEELEARTLQAIAAARSQAVSEQLPDPLEDSPKCHGCSLVGICLPDETNALRSVPPDPAAPSVRRLYPPRDDARPLYVQEQGAFVGKTGESLVVRRRGEELGRARLKDVSQVVLCGSVTISPQAIALLCHAGIPIVHLSTGHWFHGVTHGITLRNAYDRAAQFRAAQDDDRRLAFAKVVVEAKGANQRTLLRRNSNPPPTEALRAMRRLLERVPSAASIDELLGLEGMLAQHYFGEFHRLLRPKDFDVSWDFRGRNRRPPQDPVNALLSFTYALLTKECTVAALSEGLDPWWGLFHRPRHGKPALALDLMEELRPVIADSVVVTAVNTGMVAAADFETSAAGCVLRPSGRKAVLKAYEVRMDQLVTHPVFDYRVSWRIATRLQARTLARWLRGDVPSYVPMRVR